MAEHGLSVSNESLALAASDFDRIMRRTMNTATPLDGSSNGSSSQQSQNVRSLPPLAHLVQAASGNFATGPASSRRSRIEPANIQNGWEVVSAGPIDNGADRPRARRRLSSSGRAGASSAAATSSSTARSGSPRRPLLLRPSTPPLPPTSYQSMPQLSSATYANPEMTDSSVRTRGANVDSQNAAEDEFDEDDGSELRLPFISGDGRVLLFGSEGDDDHDDDDDEDGDDDDDDLNDSEYAGGSVSASGAFGSSFGGTGFPSWEDFTSSFNVLGEPQDDFDDWFLSSMRGSVSNVGASRSFGRESAVLMPLGDAAEALPESRRMGTTAALGAKGRQPPTSVNVKQEWNRRAAWKPYIYQEPVPNQNSLYMFGSVPQVKPLDMLTRACESSRMFSISPDARVLSFDCTNADDMGRGSVDNILSDDRSFFITSRANNVNLEFSFLSDNGTPHRNHCAIERIRICSPKNRYACTELLVLASSRRCDLKELAQYNDYTFAMYEKLAKRIGRRGVKAVDANGPVPIAYFWLTYEENFDQLQVLPFSKTCKYVYVKMIRGHMPDQRSMAIRLIEFHGWAGARAFSEVAVC
ncbi:hypothetical protein DL89DRAFT_268366 [Linderina pennispora]|uniref:Uncharacterized protein n=1 Tax=Linderina pennispora TaxID=61395 RepID=A0A1Y1W4R0_9FUNG|nr:uncharacterized protein DL89DRAFT_268366 [Linderina pennispora]ORX68540.1 hypothetical protein DL89DRAFT_268366 [Linderina pennispora]